ncbi:DUF1674 domain-containing protein [Lichenihabitans sp. PAMC28606]|uniref:DUF1674 domain-containing protein n=1 Tax=Lichenihabitans TaxID=2723776 RepID=UPI0010383782|nr:MULTISPECIES: DUF1674 domain-containing protein [Lichenihabitans]UDL93615.1 DUF1674 domain-containing protein [Lichenihabitans sp. PAMC28606]
MNSPKNGTEPTSDVEPAEPVIQKILSPAARRALAEAEARRAAPPIDLPPEEAGRGGLEPVRYGDWEIKGLTSDF